MRLLPGYLLITVRGDSMRPGLAPGDQLLVRRARARRKDIDRIAVFTEPHHHGRWHWPDAAAGHQRIVKRLAALPGDPMPPAIGTAHGSTVPADHVILLGDNTMDSLDSRAFGPVPQKALYGFARFRLGVQRRLPEPPPSYRDYPPSAPPTGITHHWTDPATGRHLSWTVPDRPSTQDTHPAA